jgi:integrase/recombinase XerD
VGLDEILSGARRRAGLEHATCHELRHTCLTRFDRGGTEGDLMELNGWTSPQMLRRYRASPRNARARRSYDRIMDNTT